MRHYIDTVTEEHITRDDQPGFEINLSLADLGRSSGEKPPETVKLFVPGGERIKLDLLGEAVDPEGNHLYWSYYNEHPDDAIHLIVKDD